MLEARRYVYVLFCCQQAAEKALKAVVIARTGKLAPRIHNLPRLAELAGVALDPPRLDLLADLSNYYVQTRYPDEIESVGQETDPQRVQATLDMTEETLEWLLSMLN